MGWGVGMHWGYEGELREFVWVGICRGGVGVWV